MKKLRINVICRKTRVLAKNGCLLFATRGIYLDFRGKVPIVWNNNLLYS